MVVSDEIELGPGAGSFDIRSYETCKGDNEGRMGNKDRQRVIISISLVKFKGIQLFTHLAPFIFANSTNDYDGHVK